MTKLAYFYHYPYIYTYIWIVIYIYISLSIIYHFPYIYIYIWIVIAVITCNKLSNVCTPLPSSLTWGIAVASHAHTFQAGIPSLTWGIFLLTKELGSCLLISTHIALLVSCHYSIADTNIITYG